MRWLLLLAWLVPAIAGGQEVVLSGPSSPLQPREYAQILVYGLADSDLPTASIEWSPRDGTTLMPARLWGGQPFLLFAARTPGTYTITVTQNGWRANLDAAVDAMRRAATVDADLFSRLANVHTELRNRYPVRTGSCLVTVAGDVPTPPTPPPDPSVKADQVTIVTESQEALPAEQLEAINGEAVRSAATAAGLDFQCVDKDITGPDVQRVGHVLAACQGQPVPRIVFSSAGKVIEGANVPLPATVAATVTLIQRYAADKSDKSNGPESWSPRP
jgi:hypothetical protein